MRCDCCGSSSWNELFTENGVRLGQCPGCDLLYVDDIPAVDRRMTELEDGHYAGTQAVLAAERQVQGEQVAVDRFQGYVDLGSRFASGGRWLDIGCGAGLLMDLARRAGFEAEGIELNADRRAATRQVSGLEVHGVPVEDVGFADDTFDVVSMINVFSHLTSPSATFAELRRILRPGGVLVMATGEMSSGVEKSHMFNWNLGDHLYFLGDRTIEQYADRVGLEVAHHSRTWLPDEMFSRDWLRAKGRSGAKNAVKTAIDRTPGGLRLLRAVMLRRQADSAAHSGVFVLRTPGPVQTG